MTARTRFWLLLALPAGLSLLGVAAFALRHFPAEAAPAAQLHYFLGALLLAGGVGGGWALFGLWLDLRLLRPLGELTHAADIMAHGHPEHRLELPPHALLGALPEQVAALGRALAEARAAEQGARAAGAARAERQQQRLEGVLQAMHKGLLVTDESGRILLYNPAAARLLGHPAALGLGRPVFEVFDSDTAATLRALLRQGDGAAREFHCRRGAHDLHCRASALPAGDHHGAGLIVAFDAPGRPAEAGPPALPACYDFDLGPPPDAARAEQPLARLGYAVFDTETTGLAPSAGDEIVAIAAVRIVNGRLLHHEHFHSLVNPHRPIPPASQRFHGISDAMVADQPDLAVVLPRFRDFVADDVLVAHNAAFDLAFLRRKEAATGVRLDNPVLDVLLLSSWLHPQLPDQTLEGTARRLGVTVTARHTALGDALVTAHIFLRLLPLLAARGVTTLGQALAVSEQVADVRRQQARF